MIHTFRLKYGPVNTNYPVLKKLYRICYNYLNFSCGKRLSACLKKSERFIPWVSQIFMIVCRLALSVLRPLMLRTVFSSILFLLANSVLLVTCFIHSSFKAFTIYTFLSSILTNKRIVNKNISDFNPNKGSFYVIDFCFEFRKMHSY